ncbi:hypothetical protein [Paraliomyxa miuraensis]|uniref:hypothetical protein n=1 Tax=Paraliomyxa miuraensis TaxID=376150 RepID=UPI002253E745|nr:hypothetical protein [Paraliomyxa miuraensis]MCX4247385.1 hypothetical protein [Paraliomyxa miuraensis]
MTSAREILVGLLAIAWACRPAVPPDEPDAAVGDQASTDDGEGPSLAEIADAIDPGPRPALTMELPAWLVPVLAIPATRDSRALVAEAKDEWARWKTSGESAGDAAQVQRLLGLGRALALAERAAGTVEDADVEALLVLERIYALLDAPSLANDRNAFSRLLQAFVAAVASQQQQQGEVEGLAAIDELSRLVFGVLQKSGELHRRTVAALLRKAPEHPEIPAVLGRLGPKLVSEDEALAVGALRRALALRGEAATAEHWLDLASVCSRALDVRCAREALARAEALLPAAHDDALAKRLGNVRSLVKHAHRAVELSDAAGLEDGLERATALYELQRYDEALALFEQLHRRHPDDARPVVGQARTVLTDEIDFVAAFEILERAQPREHLDRTWYELAIGVRATALIYHVLPQLGGRGPDEIFAVLRPGLLQMREDIGAFEALGADEGRVLRFIYELGMEAWPKSRADDQAAMHALAEGLLARTVALRSDVPGSFHAYVLWLAAAEFSKERQAALGVLDVPPPAEHADALAVRRAQAAVDLVAAWDARERVDGMLALVDAVDDPKRPAAVRRLVADGHALAHRLGRPQDLAALERRYRKVHDEGGALDPVVLNNLAVVLAEQGRVEEALLLWKEAADHAEDGQGDLLQLNALSARVKARGAQAAERAELESLASSGSHAEVRLLARAWQVEIATGAERREALAVLREAAKEEAKTNFRPRNLPGQGGVILRGSVNVGVGYSSLEGLQIQLDVTGVPWLVVPCPVAIPE